MKNHSDKQTEHKSKSNKIDIRKARKEKQTQYNFFTRETETDNER